MVRKLNKILLSKDILGEMAPVVTVQIVGSIGICWKMEDQLDEIGVPVLND